MEINLDKNVRLEDDFNKSINGKWLDSNEIPDENSRTDRITDDTEERQHADN